MVWNVAGPESHPGVALRVKLSQHVLQVEPERVGVYAAQIDGGEEQMRLRRFIVGRLPLIRLAVHDDPEKLLDVVIRAAKSPGQARDHLGHDRFFLRPQVVHRLIERLPQQFAPDAIDISGGEVRILSGHDRIRQARARARHRQARRGALPSRKRGWMIVNCLGSFLPGMRYSPRGTTTCPTLICCRPERVRMK